MADHYVHRLQISMPLATAEKIADGALQAGADAGLLPLTVAVLDVGVRRPTLDDVFLSLTGHAAELINGDVDAVEGKAT